MSLLILADSQVERAWQSVRQNRELLRTATFFPVKQFQQLPDGVRAINAQVGYFIHDLLSYLLYLVIIRRVFESLGVFLRNVFHFLCRSF